MYFFFRTPETNPREQISPLVPLCQAGHAEKVIFIFWVILCNVTGLSFPFLDLILLGEHPGPPPGVRPGGAAGGAWVSQQCEGGLSTQEGECELIGFRSINHI